MTEWFRLSNVSTLGRKVPAYWPLGLYCLLRLLTCVPPIAAPLIGNGPEENLSFGMDLVAYSLVHCVGVVVAYALLLGPLMKGDPADVRNLRSTLVVTAIGTIDMVGGIVAIALSGGWASPFWHMWLSSLVIPCLVIGIRWYWLPAT